MEVLIIIIILCHCNCGVEVFLIGFSQMISETCKLNLFLDCHLAVQSDAFQLEVGGMAQIFYHVIGHFI